MVNQFLHRVSSVSIGVGVLILVFSYFVFLFINSDLGQNRSDDKLLVSLNNEEVSDISSSVWCTGSNSSDRLCVFKNLCYSPKNKNFIFYHGPLSVSFGVPADRFDPALAELSSIENHNAEYFEYTDLPSSQSREYIKDAVFLKTPILIFKRFYPLNLMHVFHDDLLPLYTTLGMICRDHYDKNCNASVVFTDGNSWGPFSFLYKSLYEGAFLIQELTEARLYCFKESHIGVNKQTVWYQYGFRKPQSPVPVNINSILMHLKTFKQYFTQTLNIYSVKNAKEVVCCVILTRKTNRLILNINEVSKLLSNLTHCSVKILNLEDFGVTEIVFYIQQAKIVVGMHGSLLILSLFLKPNTIFLELFPYAINPYHYTPYKTLASIQNNLIYKTWQNTYSENTVTHMNNLPSAGGITHLSLTEQERILNSPEVPPHLCCNDPDWLFRIYQDTVVDIPSFKTVLEEALEENKGAEDKVYESWEDSKELFPTKIMNATCEINIEARTMKVEWEKPWNLEFWSQRTVEYELLIQNPSSEVVKAYNLKSLNYVFNNVDIKYDYLMWVRCIADKKPGPFTNSVSCRKV